MPFEGDEDAYNASAADCIRDEQQENLEDVGHWNGAYGFIYWCELC